MSMTEMEILASKNGEKWHLECSVFSSPMAVPARTSGLVKSDAPEVDTKSLSKSKANDNAGEHTLSSAAAATHVHFGSTLRHDNAIVVRFAGFRSRFLSTLDLNVCDVLAFVRKKPEFTDDFVDFFDFHPVKLEKSLWNSEACKREYRCHILMLVCMRKKYAAPSLLCPWHSRISSNLPPQLSLWCI